MPLFPPPTSRKVKAENKCDVCKERLASYYDTQWYIHYCSEECLNTFLEGYYKEIDEIAIEVKTAEGLFKEGEENEV